MNKKACTSILFNAVFLTSLSLGAWKDVSCLKVQSLSCCKASTIKTQCCCKKETKPCAKVQKAPDVLLGVLPSKTTLTTTTVSTRINQPAQTPRLLVSYLHLEVEHNLSPSLKDPSTYLRAPPLQLV